MRHFEMHTCKVEAVQSSLNFNKDLKFIASYNETIRAEYIPLVMSDLSISRGIIKNFDRKRDFSIFHEVEIILINLRRQEWLFFEM